MSSPFAALACLCPVLQSQTKPPTPVQWPDPIVESKRGSLKAVVDSGMGLTFSGGVRVTYGVTILTADTVTIDREAKRGNAKGHVHLEDPDAVIDAESVEFTWQTGHQSGRLQDFSGLFEGLSVESGLANVSPGHAVLENFTVHPSGSYPGLYRLKSKRLTYIAGKYVKIQGPRFRILGVDIPYHRTMTFNQDPRVKGSSLPAVSFSAGSLGANYAPNFFIDKQSSLQAWANIFRGSDPHYGFEISHTFLDPSVPKQGRIIPTSDLDARFGYGYFDNVKIESPQVEFETLKLRHNSIGFDTDVNEGASDRLPGGSITKLGELVYENGGAFGTLAQLSHIRLQSAREQGQSSFTTRFVGDTSLDLPPMKLLPDLSSVIRFDAQGFCRRSNVWMARAQLGLAVNPIKPITVSAAYVTAVEEGIPDLTTDRLYNNGAWSFRADGYFGSIRASYLLRYYLNGIFFDNEYEISQVVGALRVSVVYRTFPSDLRFGVNFRLDDLLNNLQKHHEPIAGRAPVVPLVPE